jgi:hypothetical protein
VPSVGLRSQIGQFFAKFLQTGLAGRVGFLGQRRLLDFEPGDPSGDLIQLRWHRVDFGAQPRARFVHQIDRLVG